MQIEQYAAHNEGSEVFPAPIGIMMSVSKYRHSSTAFNKSIVHMKYNRIPAVTIERMGHQR